MDLVFVAELDGFQHGPGPFHLKRIVIFPIQGGTPATYTFTTDFLFDDPDHAQTTYRYATRHLHGLPMALPGIPYQNQTDVLTAYFKTRAYHFLENTGDSTETVPRILILVKGQQKGDLLHSLLPQEGTLANLEIHNLEDYGCPSAHTLVGCRSSTGARAAVFAAWLRGRYTDSLPSLLATLPFQF